MSPDTIGWSRQAITVPPKAPVQTAEISLIFRGYLRGAVLFDDISLQQALPTAV
jgi:hypothetical protein